MIPAAVVDIVRHAARAIASLAAASALLLASSTAAADEIRYTVRPGDNPWNVTERFLRSVDDWPRLQQLNAITAPDRMPPGMILRIPVAWLRGTPAPTLVIATHGDVGRTASDSTRFEPIGTTATLGMGTRVRTGVDGHATLQFVDGSRVQLLPESEVAIRRSLTLALGAGTVIEVDLVRGAVENVVRPRAGSGGRFEIRTPAAIAAVRGTEFRVGAGDDAARSEVEGGTVRFGNRRGERDLTAGFGAIAKTGAPPAAPVALLRAPDLSPLPSLVERVPLELAFPPLAGAKAYRVQFAPDVVDATVQTGAVGVASRVRVPDLPDGRYLVRVRGIDADGLEGLDAEHGFRLHARPEPPVLIDPAPDAQSTADRPVLTWAEVANAKGFRVQLSADPTFATLLADRTDPAPTFQPDHALEPGVYRWRVATLDATSSEGPFSDPQNFRRVLAAPGIDPPEQSGEALTLRWRDAGPGARYALQVGGDDAFARPMVDESLTEARYVMKKPGPGTYHLRVRAIAADGFAGPWGTPQKIVVKDDGPNLWPLLLLLLIPVLF